MPTDGKINYRNIANFYNKDLNCFKQNVKPITIKKEIKVFSYKYVYSEGDCGCSIEPCNPGKGDDIGFLLVFGNYGEETYHPIDSQSTVRDTLDLTLIEKASLKVMDICTNCDFIIYNITDDKVVEKGDSFDGGVEYILEVRKCCDESEEYYGDFCLPCHSVFCASILFQVEFEDCNEPGPEPEPGDDFVNGGFEVEGKCSLDGWTKIDIPAGFVKATDEFKYKKDGENKELKGKDSKCFALLRSGKVNESAILKQSVDVVVGQVIDYYAFFHLTEGPQSDPAVAKVVIKNTDGVVRDTFTHSVPYISDDWEHHQYIITVTETIVFEASISKPTSPVAMHGYLAIDEVNLS
ncbi:hypothetical protein [Clostridium sp. CMCC3677]|uniref:hypothetical protein n=1 Tax=Clostridium sp. CMCC3677 TaxID=2949963 RepID=UPI0013F0D753|nr:hypothetical protein [Clostridium sp. CMCC3677]NFG62216.1 hypothetical protein [Clostridium botulinum]NFQ09542.1 hypothetical protein [Clostridium botulinum]